MDLETRYCHCDFHNDEDDSDVNNYEDRIKCLEELVRKYKYDSLTGMMGKLDCMTTSMRLFEEYIFSGNSFYFVLADIDGLHNINRTHGYYEGDKTIKTIADKLKQHFHLHQLYRISGDEFVVLIRSYMHSKNEIKEKLDSIPGITYAFDECSNGYITPKHMFKKLDSQLCEKKCSKKRM